MCLLSAQHIPGEAWWWRQYVVCVGKGVLVSTGVPARFCGVQEVIKCWLSVQVVMKKNGIHGGVQCNSWRWWWWSSPIRTTPWASYPLSTHSIQVPLMDLWMSKLASRYLLQKCTVHSLVDSLSVITAQLSTGQPLVHTTYKPATVRTMTKYWSYYWRDCNQKLCTITQSLPVMTHYSWWWKLKDFS